MSRIQKATKKQSRLRAAIDGPAGSGKTFTGLWFAHALAEAFAPAGHAQRVGVIDTERGSASKYASEIPEPGAAPFDFDEIKLERFGPADYTDAIQEFDRAGYTVLLIDSLSHAWEGIGGALDQVDRAAAKSNNKFTAWKDITPQHRRMVDAILACRAHVIVTMRTKNEYVLETNEKGKQVPRRIGVKPIQREGMEYEFDLYASMDLSHVLTVGKTRCRAVDGAVVPSPTARFLAPVIEWLRSGDAVALADAEAIAAGEIAGRARGAAPAVLREVVAAAMQAGATAEAVLADARKRYGDVPTLVDLTDEQAVALLGRYQALAKARTRGVGPGKNDVPAPVAPPASPVSTASLASVKPPSITPEQLEKIKAAFEELKAAGMTREDWLEILAKRGVTTARDLTEALAADLLAKLHHRLDLLRMERGLYPENDAGGAAPEAAAAEPEADAGAVAPDTEAAAGEGSPPDGATADEAAPTEAAPATAGPPAEAPEPAEAAPGAAKSPPAAAAAAGSGNGRRKRG